jgi:hypothetical protein
MKITSVYMTSAKNLRQTFEGFEKYQCLSDLHMIPKGAWLQKHVWTEPSSMSQETQKNPRGRQRQKSCPGFQQAFITSIPLSASPHFFWTGGYSAPPSQKLSFSPNWRLRGLKVPPAFPN